MNKPIRILQVLAGMNRGGSETFIMNVYRKLDKTKVQFDFILFREEECDYNEEIRKLGGKIYWIPRYNGRNHVLFKNAWRSFFKEHPEYKIIHGHVRSTASIYLRIANNYGLTTIAHSHNTSSGKGLDAVVKNILQYPIRFIANHRFACSKKAGIWLFGKKVPFTVLNNAIDTKSFIFNKQKRESKRKELNLQNKLVIGHVGRFHMQKNHDFLIDIFNEVLNKRDDVVLLLVGDGELRFSIERKIEDLKLNHSIILAGIQSDISEMLQAMDVFVFPSLFEGLGIVVVEAQASGMPCVIADTIPEEAYVTELIEKLSLKDSTTKWANKIIEVSGSKRKDTHKEIIKSGYDIKETTAWLEKFYITSI